MEQVLIALVAFLASGLTFFTGFGLGTLLLPAFALFFPIPTAVALTAVVHFLNGLFKLVLVGRRAHLGVALRFGLPAALAALAGARLLTWLSVLPPLAEYELGGRPHQVLPVKVAVAILMVAFALVELNPRIKELALPPRFLPLGGLVSGFFGGLSGHQGAFRSVFLLRTGLDKGAFIATGVTIAVAVDLSRLAVYAGALVASPPPTAPLIAGVGGAFAGAFLGSRLLDKMSLRGIERGVSVLLLAVATALAAGWI